MSTKNDGGTAFPHLETTSMGEPYHDHLGTSQRAYIASEFLAGYISAFSDPDAAFPAPPVAAQVACKYADALIAELAK